MSLNRLENSMRKTVWLSIPLLAALACAGRSDTADTAAAMDTSAAVGATTSTGGEAQVNTQTGLVDPNAATQQQLAGVAGLDSAAAAAVIAGRPYADMRAVDRVLVARNLTAEQRKTVYAKLWKPIDLNTASDAEILLIPGIGSRMLHEFKEYRPYTSIAQFRREMGKYVDNAEVTRLEQYVSIK
jgi:DNA uptake protein ComE-like DNA-binding protein